jgi:sulfite reductase alpha subunit-like flavoprotein
MGRKKKGLCSNWIEKIHEDRLQNYQINFEIKEGRFPQIKNRDQVIVIATGTGIAPIRSFLLNRFLFKEKDTLGITLLFYGCRNKSKDYLYGREFEHFSENKNLNFKLFPAFSRDQENKIYVQHLIKENYKLFRSIFQEQASHLILVGNSKILPKCIDKAIKYCFTIDNFLNEEEADKIIVEKKQKNKFHIETW